MQNKMSPSDVQDNKRQRTIGSASDKVIANDVIKLKFHEGSSYFDARPEYCHQLFKEEEIENLTVGESYEIAINIDCRNLSHEVVYSENITPIDRQVISDNLQLALPKGTVDVDSDSKEMSTKSTCCFPGKLVHEFAVAGENYEILLATAADEGASELLGRAEKVAMWFIETADAVDFSDDRWEVLFLFRTEHSDGTEKNTSAVPTRYFAGYMTLFTFHNPMLGSKIRVCQALVTPVHQGRGLGRELLQAVYRLVRARDNIVELTVEDPAPGFQRLRDVVDFAWFVEHFPPKSVEGQQPKEADVSTELKVTKAQAAFVLEAAAYVDIVHKHRSANTKGNVHSNAAFKEFRLEAKRRLYRVDKELRLLAKADMQRELADMFDEQLRRYQAVLKTAERLGLLAADPAATASS